MSDPRTSHLNAIPGYTGSHPGIQVGSRVAHDAPDSAYRQLVQLGVDWVMVMSEDPALHTLAQYREWVDRAASLGVPAYRIANPSVHNMASVVLGLGDRDAKIEEYQTYLRNLGEAGIRYCTYAHMGNGIWTSGLGRGRGGSRVRFFDPDAAWGRWNGKRFHAPLTHDREYASEELWEHYAYFVEQIVPVAEEFDVRIGIHPDDPPVLTLGGIPRIFGSFAGYERALAIADSSHVGVCLCTGCWSKGGPDGMGIDIPTAIREFARRAKLFKVHLGNVTNPLPLPFRETFIDDGYVDTAEVVRTLHEVEFDGCITPDHIPQIDDPGGEELGLGYTIGMIRGLIAAAQSSG